MLYVDDLISAVRCLLLDKSRYSAIFELVGAATCFASAVEWSDLVVLLQAHDEIVGSAALDGAEHILDTRGVLTGDNVERL